MYNFPEQYSDALRLLCEGMLGSLCNPLQLAKYIQL